MIDLSGRVAIVTGAGSGLGRTHALALAKRGAKVVVNDLADEPAAEVCHEIMQIGGTAMPIAANVADVAGVDSMVSSVIDAWGQVDILVNNAGVLRDRTFAKLEIADFQKVLDVHLMGSVICSKAVWPSMRATGFGRIIFTASSSGLFGNFGQSNYGAAKMALVGLMQTLALEGEKYGIRVNCIAPSAMTAMTDGLFSEDAASTLDPALVSPGVVFLSSDKAPNRIVLLAGGGSFEAAHITMTRGIFVGGGDEAADRLAEGFGQVVSREGEFVPARGEEQPNYECARALAMRSAVPVS